MPSIHLIEEDHRLEAIIPPMKAAMRLSVDLEGEWNLHRYGLHLCLIQLTVGDDIFLVDPLKVIDLRPVWNLLEDPSLQKISHGCQSDLVLLDYRFQVHPRNIFDTQKASQLLGYETTSLGALLDRYFALEKNMKVRVSDWNQRPLTDKMVEYAALDVEYLSELADRLTEELQAKGRWEWFTEECQMLEEVRHKPKESPHLELPGANKLTRRQRNVLKAIYELREKIAEELDKPAYHIMANPRMVELAADLPTSLSEWRSMRGVHSTVGRRAEEFHEAVQNALQEKVTPYDESGRDFPPFGMKLDEFRRWSDKRIAQLEPVQVKIQQDYPDVAIQIFSTRTLKRIATGEISLSDLRKWQQGVITEAAASVGLDIGEMAIPV